MQDTLVLKRPIITEKASRMRESNQFVLEVSARATKGQIKQDVESRFKVNVLSVKTIKLPGKFRRKMGPVGGYEAVTKKAILRLKPGQQITWDEAS